jgi:hypothetical protein
MGKNWESVQKNLEGYIRDEWISDGKPFPEEYQRPLLDHLDILKKKFEKFVTDTIGLKIYMKKSNHERTEDMRKAADLLLRDSSIFPS